VGSLDRFPLTIRIANALVSYIIYIGKMFWPVKLAAFYPHPGVLPWWQVAAACLLLVFISFLAIRYLKHRPWFIVGWLWYIGTFVPVIGLVQVGYQAMADRYTYVPLIGLFVIAAWGVPDLVSRLVSGLNHKRIGLAASTAALFLILMIISWFQVSYWKNSITLFKHAVEVTSNNHVMHDNLGFALTARGRADEAIKHFKEAIRINPDDEKTYLNMGIALLSQGKLDECIDYYSEVLRVNPDYAIIRNNLGIVLFHKGKTEEAIAHFREALRIELDYAEAHNSLGVALAFKDKVEEAVVHFREALRIKPDYAIAKKNLAKYLSSGKKVYTNPQ
jgi:tetratricopeptide (TPR) repeat protein